MPINPAQWLRVKDVFHAALERKLPEQVLFVRATCADDGIVCAEVERLLAACASAGRFIEPPPYGFGAGAARRYGRKTAIVVALFLLAVRSAL